MARPITWQTVRAGSDPAEALRPLIGAQNSINGAFDSFNNIIKQREAIDQANMLAGQETLKQNYLDRLAQAKTPEELAAMQQSGGLALGEDMGNKLRAELRGAGDARQTVLRQGVVANQAYDAGQLAVTRAPMINQAKALIAKGDPTSVAAGFKILDENDLGDESGMYTAGTAANRDTVLRERADKLAPLTLANAERAGELGKLQLKAAKQTAADTEETRELMGTLARAAAENTAALAGVTAEQSRLAKDLQLPMTATGTPDFANMSPKQLGMFNEEAAVIGLPGSTASTTGDTAQGNALFKRLAASGKYSPQVLAANEDAIRSALSTTPKPLVGNDAFNLALATAQNTVGFDRQDANNWYSPNSPDARRSYEDLAAKIPDIVKSSTSGFSPDEDVDSVQRLIGEIGAIGIERKDGTYVVPSANDVLRFVRSSKGGWFTDDERAKNIKAELTKWVNTPEAMKMAKDGEESQKFRDKQRVLQLLREAGNPPKKQ